MTREYVTARCRAADAAGVADTAPVPGRDNPGDKGIISRAAPCGRAERPLLPAERRGPSPRPPAGPQDAAATSAVDPMPTALGAVEQLYSLWVYARGCHSTPQCPAAPCFPSGGASASRASSTMQNMISVRPSSRPLEAFRHTFLQRS